MSNTVDCPECHRPAVVEDRFRLVGPQGPVEYLRIRCTGLLPILVVADEVRAPALAAAA